MEKLTREMTFEEEYIILQKEVKELFNKEDEESEPPKSHCVVRRALRCIKKLIAELEPYKEEKCNKLVYLANKSVDKIDAINKEYIDGYNKGVDDFMKSIICGIRNKYPDMPIVDIFGSREKWKEKNSQYLECENLAYKIAEQLKCGGR